jgi:hypothetical protein
MDQYVAYLIGKPIASDMLIAFLSLVTK